MESIKRLKKFCWFMLQAQDYNFCLNDLACFKAGGELPNKVLNVKVCDATGAAQWYKAGYNYQIIPKILI